MKRFFAVFVALFVILGALSGCTSETEMDEEETTAASYEQMFIAETTLPEVSYMDNLIAEAQSEGELVVYGAGNDYYLSDACEKFEALYGIPTKCLPLTTETALVKIKAANCEPEADVVFGGSIDLYRYCALAGYLESYEAENAAHLLSTSYRDVDGYWYGIGLDVLGFLVNENALTISKLDVPVDWQDLTQSKYKGHIALSNYNIAATAKQIVNTVVQKYGHDEGITYLKDLDKNVVLYAISGLETAKSVASGEASIGICFLEDAIAQIPNSGLEFIIPETGTSYTLEASAILKGCTHPNAAKLWMEFVLSSECISLAQANEIVRFPVIDNVLPPVIYTELGIDSADLMQYDFEDVRKNSDTYIADIIRALGYKVDKRFQTE